MAVNELWRSSQVHHHAKFHRNRSSGCGDITVFFNFSRWRPSTISISFFAFLDHPQSIFAGLYWCAKFRWNPCSSFDNMKVWIFCAFGLKMPIHASKIMVFGVFDPLNGEVYQQNQNPQKAHPCMERRHMTYRLSKSVHRFDLCACPWDQKKTMKETLWYSGKVGIHPDHPRRPIEYHLACWLVFRQ